MSETVGGHTSDVSATELCLEVGSRVKKLEKWNVGGDSADKD